MHPPVFSPCLSFEDFSRCKHMPILTLSCLRLHGCEEQLKKIITTVIDEEIVDFPRSSFLTINGTGSMLLRGHSFPCGGPAIHSTSRRLPGRSSPLDVSCSSTKSGKKTTGVATRKSRTVGSGLTTRQVRTHALEVSSCSLCWKAGLVCICAPTCHSSSWVPPCRHQPGAERRACPLMMKIPSIASLVSANSTPLLLVSHSPLAQHLPGKQLDMRCAMPVTGMQRSCCATCHSSSSWFVCHLKRELLFCLVQVEKGSVWTFEQTQALELFNVFIPVRMTVIKLKSGG